MTKQGMYSLSAGEEQRILIQARIRQVGSTTSTAKARAVKLRDGSRGESSAAWLACQNSVSPGCQMTPSADPEP